ncbi:MAG: hypothetical protein Q7R35_08405 [Elusimicrobiota bacterium]|nr:hypothetical protein [Elusimicrobiota bacterium]
MKKPVIIIIVGILAVILFLQYMQRKSAAPIDIGLTPGQSAENIPGGVSLPAESTAYAASPEGVAEPAKFAVPSAKTIFTPPAAKAARGAIAAIPAEFAKQTLCAGKSLNDILASHGKVWGYSAYSPEAFTKPENDAVYGLLAKFFSCQAVVYGDLDMCNYVPGVQHKLDKYFTTPNYQCVDPSVKVLFYAYAAGKFKSELPCHRYFEGDNVTGAKVPPEFCTGAAQGFAFVCNHPKAGNNKAKCRQAFPSNRDDCSNADCLDNVSLYSALKDNNLSGCPEKYMSECAAFFTKSPTSCSVILEKLGGIYCQSLSAHEQSGDSQKKLAEEAKKEEQKRIAEINKQAKKLLGKE